LQAIAEGLADEDYAKAFTKMVADEVATALGEIRNAVVASDRAHFLFACRTYSEALCRAICLLNRRYVSGRARLREMTKQMPVLPNGFATLIDAVSGAALAPDQEAYDAAEALCSEIERIKPSALPLDTDPNKLRVLP
jgi:hypothetical protein